MPNNQDDFIAVYLFLGFLESGKTSFIRNSLSDEKFNVGERILLLICEEGVEEFDPAGFGGRQVFIRTIEDESELTPENLAAMQAECNADCVIMEYNGMWQIASLFNNLPEDWAVYQTILLADATTFQNYNANMRSLVVDKLNMAELIIFNRYNESMKVEDFHQIVRGVSRQNEIYYEFPDGRMMFDDIEDPLPFDIEADPIIIEDRDFALFYRDITEEPEKYEGKRVTFKGLATQGARLPKGTFAVGRHIMTCCVDDIKFCWLGAKYTGPMMLKEQTWVMMMARVVIPHTRSQKFNMPFLEVISMAPAMPPEQEVATFY